MRLAYSAEQAENAAEAEAAASVPGFVSFIWYDTRGSGMFWSPPQYALSRFPSERQGYMVCLMGIEVDIPSATWTYSVLDCGWA